MTISPVKIWRNQKYARKFLGKSGKIESFTKIYTPPLGFEGKVPYVVVLVSLGAEKMVGQMVDFEEEDLQIGKAVYGVLRRVKNVDKDDVIPYGVKFKPVEI